jgi:hypothetical protein
MNWKKPLALATTLAVLGSVAAWLEYSHRPKREAQEEAKKKLLPIKDRQIAKIALSDGGSRRVLIQCLDLDQKLCKSGDNSRWEVLEPSRLRADDSNVNSLLSTVNNVAANDEIDLKEETNDKRQSLLREYGLSAEARKARILKRIELTFAKGETQVAWLGDAHPLGEMLYVMLGDDEKRVLLVPNYFKASFEHDLTYWRDKKLLSLKPTEIAQFELKSAKGSISGVRKEGLWTLGAGKEDLAGDIESIDTLLSTATYLAAKQFASEKKSDNRARTVLRNARLALTLNLVPDPGKGQPVTLQLFEKSGASKGLLATTSQSDPLYELDPSHLARLTKTVKDLRLAKLMTSMERYTVRRLEFLGGALKEQPLVLKGDGAKWQVEGTPGDASNDKVQELLDRLSGNRIQDFLQGKSIPSGEAAGMTVTLGDEKSPQKRKIVFWKAAAGVFARDLLSPRPEAFKVDPAIWSSLPTSRDHFKFTAQPAKPSATQESRTDDHGHEH